LGGTTRPCGGLSGFDDSRSAFLGVKQPRIAADGKALLFLLVLVLVVVLDSAERCRATPLL
jgi:hypothetical protein